MANSNFRSDRARDPLAELARLIGQGDAPSEGHSHESYESVRPRASAASDDDWAPEDRYAASSPRNRDGRYAPDPRVEGRYAAPTAPSYPPTPSPSEHYAPHQEYAPDLARDRDYEEPAGSRYFSGPAARFNGFREEPGQGLQPYDDVGSQHLPGARDLAAYPADDYAYEVDEQHYAEDEGAAPADDDYRDAPRSGRRTALVAVMAVFGLMIVGTAGAFGYRAMFGGSVLPTLPPIIKANNGPNKIALDPQATAANNVGQAGVTTTGSTENLVSREEQPVTIEAPRAAPRVVSTIPIATNGQAAMPPGMSGMPPATTGQTGSPWPAPPSTLPAPSQAAAPAAAPPPPVSSEPKKIHTVTIRTDQTGAVPDSAAGSSAPAAAATHAQSRPAGSSKTTAAVATGGSGPMSLAPGGQGDAAPAPAQAPQRTRVAAAPPAAASTTAHASGGGSFVQVTSRRSEAEAQADFRAMQAKFPDQLGGREPVIRRADLGEKGTYFRALVGPFGSAEEAAQLCGGLKAAGGNCIVQRN